VAVTEKGGSFTDEEIIARARLFENYILGKDEFEELVQQAAELFDATSE
jgi:hypothetical protein